MSKWSRERTRAAKICNHQHLVTQKRNELDKVQKEMTAPEETAGGSGQQIPSSAGAGKHHKPERTRKPSSPRCACGNCSGTATRTRLRRQRQSTTPSKTAAFAELEEEKRARRRRGRGERGRLPRRLTSGGEHDAEDHGGEASVGKRAGTRRNGAVRRGAEKTIR